MIEFWEALSRYHRYLFFGAWIWAFSGLLPGDQRSSFLSPIMGWILIPGLTVLIGMLLAEKGSGIERSLSVEFTLRLCILLLPLLFLVPARNKILDSFALEKRLVGMESLQSSDLAAQGGGSVSSGSGQAADETVYRVTLRDLLKEPEAYKGRWVLVEGMVHHTQGLPESHFMLFRFVITCCAADAQPVVCLVSSPGLRDIPENEWVQVGGRFTLDRTDATRSRPLLVEANVRTIPRPSRPYL